MLAATAVACSAALAGSAGAARPAGQYVIGSIVLTYATSVTTTGAVDSKGAAGTLKTTLTATLKGKATGGPVGLETPEVLSEYLCSPTCPAFEAGGTVKIVETFKPTGGKAVRCTSVKVLPKGARGQLQFASSATSKKVITVTLNQTATANDLYGAARKPACRTPDHFPVDSSDYSGFGSVSIPVAALGRKTISVKLRNKLKPSTYPWASTGANAMAATVTLSRKG
jgi:hypothetical protein